MAETVLEVQALDKAYGNKYAVRDLSLAVMKGDVYGFLGLNGAGKTTTIQMILRLIRPTAGRILLFGKDARTEFLQIAPRIGALLEQPAFHPHLTGRENLALLARLSKRRERRRIDEVLEMVQFQSAASKKFETYSQGMKQTLGLAQVFLDEPDFAILDEPTNGLDPEAIQNFRSLIRHQVEERGMTFFISSHLLNEVELTCNSVAMIHEGSLVVAGRVDELIHPEIREVTIRVTDPRNAAASLRSFPACKNVQDGGNQTVQVQANRKDLAAINRHLVSGGFEVSEFTPKRRTLENYFMERLDGGSPHVA